MDRNVLRDAQLLRNIQDAVAGDANLSMLPEEFKNEAIFIMYEEAIARRNGEDVPMEEKPQYSSNKRACIEMDQ